MAAVNNPKNVSNSWIAGRSKQNEKHRKCFSCFQSIEIAGKRDDLFSVSYQWELIVYQKNEALLTCNCFHPKSIGSEAKSDKKSRLFSGRQVIMNT
jgi:hypothetical protein